MSMLSAGRLPAGAPKRSLFELFRDEKGDGNAG